MSQPTRQQQADALKKDWAENPRWKGIKRGYTAEDVVRLRGSFPIEHTLAKRGAEKLWNLINTEPFVNSLGALTGNQAMQQVKAGLKAIPRPEPVLGGLGAQGRQAHQRHLQAR
jgi:isocitrate lyase